MQNPCRCEEAAHARIWVNVRPSHRQFGGEKRPLQLNFTSSMSFYRCCFELVFRKILCFERYPFNREATGGAHVLACFSHRVIAFGETIAVRGGGWGVCTLSGFFCAGEKGVFGWVTAGEDLIG